MLPEISSAMLVVTHRCNLECRYCFVKQKNEDMDLATAREAARSRMQWGEGTQSALQPRSLASSARAWASA